MDVSLDPTELVPQPISVLLGILICKFVYEITGSLSSSYIKVYANLRKDEKIEWNNRGFSTFHAILVSSVSFYMLFVSDIFNDNGHPDYLVVRKSPLSDAIFGVSLGYFISDLGMILYLFPSLGGMEYILHHGLSMYSIFLALISGKGHIYILMTLTSECTTPFINLRWYLDIAGQKSSRFYFYNGVAMFLGWLVARIFLFIYMFVHMYLHFDQFHPFLPEYILTHARSISEWIRRNRFPKLKLPFFHVRNVFRLGFYSLLTISPILAMMNVYWFWKIFKGLIKTMSKKKHVQ